MSALTRGPVVTITGTVGTSSLTVLAANKATNYLRVHCPSSTLSLAVTYDGITIPVINGAGITINSLAADEHAIFVPTGAVQIIGSSSNTPYTVEYA